jgi:SAM-dependent methyltransferase
VNFRYRILYRLGITPWERDQVPRQLQEVAAEFPQPGRALDVGCGTGRDAVYLAQQGWTVSAIDSVQQALDAARARAKSAGVEVNWVQGDVTRLPDSGVGEAFELVLDRGCFHGLGDEARERCAHGITAVTARGAQLLMFAFAPGWHGPAPRGIGAPELARCFGERWELIASEPDPEAQLPRWLRNADPTWHRLRKRA